MTAEDLIYDDGAYKQRTEKELKELPTDDLVKLTMILQKECEILRIELEDFFSHLCTV